MSEMIDFTIPLTGLDRATASLDRTASRIAGVGQSAPGDTLDLSSEMVALIEAKRTFQTNAKVIQSEDDLTKSLLNLIG